MLLHYQKYMSELQYNFYITIVTRVINTIITVYCSSYKGKLEC